MTHGVVVITVFIVLGNWRLKLKLLTIRQLKYGRYRFNSKYNEKAKNIITALLIVWCITWLFLGINIPRSMCIWWVLALLLGYVLIFSIAFYVYCCYCYIGEWE